MSKVTAMTLPDLDREIPSRRIAGELTTEWVEPLQVVTYSVDGVGVYGDSIESLEVDEPAPLEGYKEFGKAETRLPTDVLGNIFCPTGPGGGKDPTCSPGGSSEYLTAKLVGSFRKADTHDDNFLGLDKLKDATGLSDRTFAKVVEDAYRGGAVSLHTWEGFGPKPDASVTIGDQIYHFASLR